MRASIGIVALAAAASFANAALVTSHTDTGVGGATVDGVLSPNEYGPGNSYVYTGGGSGFGGTVGSGQLYLKSDGTNLYIGFQPGNNLNDLVTIQLDTRVGGFTDATSTDFGDGARRASSNLNGNADDAYPAGFLVDYSIVIASFGIVSFEHTGGALNFLNFSGTFSGNAPTFREYALPLSTLSIGTGFDFFVGYVADSGYGSNESMPGGAINLGGNVGDSTTSPGYENHHHFNVIPAPASLALLGLGGLAVARRRR